MKQLSRTLGKTALLAVIGLAGSHSSTQAATLYVSTSGAALPNNPTAAQKSAAYAAAQNSGTPARFTSALLVAQANDTLEFAPGTYNKTNLGSVSGFAVAVIDRSNLTLKARNRATDVTTGRSIIQATTNEASGFYHVFYMKNQNDIKIDGFEIESVALNNATSQSPINGITIEGCDRVTCQYNVVHDNPSGGIVSVATRGTQGVVLDASDYIVFDHNIVYNNCFYSPFEGSGLSILHCKNANTGDANFHSKITSNRVFNNIIKTPGKHTDGNGIIVDTLSGNNPYPGYAPFYPVSAYKDMVGNPIPRMVVENNLSYLNGGRGIHVLNSANVTVRNNSTYQNLQDPTVNDGEITVQGSRDNRIVNNIAYGLRRSFLYTFTDPDEMRFTPTFSYSGPANLESSTIWRSNTYFNGSININDVSKTASYWPNTIEANPQFYYVGSGNALNYDFTPSYQSPNVVIDNGSNTGGSSATGDYAGRDFIGTLRPQYSVVDRGAYERKPAASMAAPSGSQS